MCSSDLHWPLRNPSISGVGRRREIQLPHVFEPFVTSNDARESGKGTGKEVAELLTALTGTEIDKKKVELPSAIKEFGSYDASVRLYAGVVAPFKLKVEEL